MIASFLTLGMDILLDAETRLTNWQAQPAQRHELEMLLDEMTTLGHGAHQAELWQVDEICEGLLDLYGAVEEGSLAVTPRMFEVARQAHEALLDLFDEVAAGQDSAPARNAWRPCTGCLTMPSTPWRWAWSAPQG